MMALYGRQDLTGFFWYEDLKYSVFHVKTSV